MSLLMGIAMICQVNTGNKSYWSIDYKQKSCQKKLAECLEKKPRGDKYILKCIKERK